MPRSVVAGYTALYTVLGDTRLHRRSRSEESMERLIQTVSREEDRSAATSRDVNEISQYSKK